MRYRRAIFFVLEVIGGGVFAALVGWFVLNYLLQYDQIVNELIRLATYILAVMVGVYLTGQFLGEDGSLLFAFLGSALGGTVVWVVTGPLSGGPPNLIDLLVTFFSSLAILGPLLATLGYNLSLRERVE